jgi:hypothetical protein
MRHRAKDVEDVNYGRFMKKVLPWDHYEMKVLSYHSGQTAVARIAGFEPTPELSHEVG